MWRGLGPPDSGWGLHCGPGRAVHLAETDPHLQSRSRGIRANINTRRATLMNSKHELLESCTLSLYIMPLQLHVGINII